jgi:hypothetical protein
LGGEFLVNIVVIVEKKRREEKRRDREEGFIHSGVARGSWYQSGEGGGVLIRVVLRCSIRRSGTVYRSSSVDILRY